MRVPPTHGKDPHSFLNVARTALGAHAPGQARTGRMVALAGVVLAVAMLLCWALKPGFWPQGFDFVISACLSLGALLLFGGIGTWMQLERARGTHPDKSVDDVRAVLRILIVFALYARRYPMQDNYRTI